MQGVVAGVQGLRGSRFTQFDRLAVVRDGYAGAAGGARDAQQILIGRRCYAAEGGFNGFQGGDVALLQLDFKRTRVGFAAVFNATLDTWPRSTV